MLENWVCTLLLIQNLEKKNTKYIRKVKRNCESKITLRNGFCKTLHLWTSEGLLGFRKSCKVTKLLLISIFISMTGMILSEL